MKKTVLIIVENSAVPFDPRVWNEATCLQAHGYRVIVLCQRAPSHLLKYEVLDGIHIYRHPMPKEGPGMTAYALEYVWALFFEFLYAWRIYFKHGFHVIQGCNPPDDIFLVALPFKLLGVKYIFDHHDACPELYLAKYSKRGILYRLTVLLEKLTYRCADIVMATNESYKTLALTRGRCNQDDVFVVRNGPKLAKFPVVRPNDAWKYGKRYLVGYVGVMSVQDGLDILVDVAQRIKEQGRKDVHFTCVGPGPALPMLKALVSGKNLEDMVTFTGRIPEAELIEILSTADVCVNPDRPCEMNNISTMIKITEYMALGKPIVQFESKEGMFTAREASLYANPEDQVGEFANKILWLLDHPSEREKMGRFGRRRFESEISWEHSIPHLLAAYQRAFDKKPRNRGPALQPVRTVCEPVEEPEVVSGAIDRKH